jgi:hypothetical protein
MSILKIKINLYADYDSTAASWTLTQGDAAHVKTGDGLAVSSSTDWETPPSSVTVASVAAQTFTTGASPAQDASAVFVKTYELIDPSSLQWDISDVEASDGSGTNQLGVAFRTASRQSARLHAPGAPWSKAKWRRCSAR